MSASKRTEDFERVFEHIRRHPGVTERALLRAISMTAYRFREIALWMIEHEVVSATRVGSRGDPHDDSREITIMAYSARPGVNLPSLRSRLSADDLARREGKRFDATALVAAWR